MNKHFKLHTKFIFLFLITFFVFSGRADHKTNLSDIVTVNSEQNLIISYIDVGQGDSIFIQLPNDETILIDAGNQGDGAEIIRYVKNSGTDTLDYVIATHPHADHIGSMSEVINAFAVKKVYMPKALHTSQTFENLLDTIEKKGLMIETAKAGKTMFDNGSVKAEFIAPNSDSYFNLNNYSAVLLLTYNDKRFLFMGDAERESENEIITNYSDISADVLKVGHHGSNTSSARPFIEKVKPSYAIISVGVRNNYGHPDMETVDVLQSINADIWRTDEKGTIAVTCDGKKISISRIDNSVQPNAPPVLSPAKSDFTEENCGALVYITKSGTKYHRDGCRYLRGGKIPVDFSKLDTNKYTPCSVCKPTAN